MKVAAVFVGLLPTVSSEVSFDGDVAMATKQERTARFHHTGNTKLSEWQSAKAPFDPQAHVREHLDGGDDGALEDERSRRRMSNKKKQKKKEKSKMKSSNKSKDESDKQKSNDDKSSHESDRADAIASARPTSLPTMEPSKRPTSSPSRTPTTDPTSEPSLNPTRSPSTTPTQRPTDPPSNSPSHNPTRSPSKHPTIPPSNSPSHNPTHFPSKHPTIEPSKRPSEGPTSFPSTSPITDSPTTSPSSSPTNSSTPLRYCPPAYDELQTNYSAGDLVEVMSNIFECAGGQDDDEVFLYEPYCNIPDGSAFEEAEFLHWSSAWALVGECYMTDTPTASPKHASSEAPSLNQSFEPSLRISGRTSNRASDVPSETHSFEPSVAPSKSPSNGPKYFPSTSPITERPTTSFSSSPTPLRYCPPAYDASQTHYTAGDLVEVMSDIFECAGGQDEDAVYLYEPYCNVASGIGLEEAEMEYWKSAWAYIGECYTTDTPTTSPSRSPISWSPTSSPTPLRYCPPAYDASQTHYTAGDLVEVMSGIFECAGGQDEGKVYLYEPYCNVAVGIGLKEAELIYWKSAWAYIGECYTTDTPTASPTYASSDVPSLNQSFEPSEQSSGRPSNRASDVPSITRSFEPSVERSGQPSVGASTEPSMQPSMQRSELPSIAKSGTPSVQGSERPSARASDVPSVQSSLVPSVQGSDLPSLITDAPTDAPTEAPTDAPPGAPSPTDCSLFCFEKSSDCSGSLILASCDDSIAVGERCRGRNGSLNRPDSFCETNNLNPNCPSPNGLISQSVWKRVTCPTPAGTSPPVSLTDSQTSESKDAPTDAPTNNPVTSFQKAPPAPQYCPPAYDPLKTDYSAGDFIEHDLHIFECARAPYERYCNIPDDSSLGRLEQHLWMDAWVHVSACYRTQTPTKQPSGAPTSMYWYPDFYAEEKTCKLGFDFPVWMEYRKETYLYNSQEECCAEHHCKTQYWYPDLHLNSEKVCRNDDKFPPWMGLESNAPFFLFNTESECCFKHGCDDSIGNAQTSTERSNAEEPSLSPTVSPSRDRTQKPATSVPTTEAPSTSPTASPQTVVPTVAPTQLPVCPETYDPTIASSYTAGSQVEINRVMYRCINSLFSLYCAQPDFRPQSDVETLWMIAWEDQGPCSVP